jgi:hypothetical protein
MNQSKSVCHWMTTESLKRLLLKHVHIFVCVLYTKQRQSMNLGRPCEGMGMERWRYHTDVYLGSEENDETSQLWQMRSRLQNRTEILMSSRCTPPLNQIVLIPQRGLLLPYGKCRNNTNNLTVAVFPQRSQSRDPNEVTFLSHINRTFPHPTLAHLSVAAEFFLWGEK